MRAQCGCEEKSRKLFIGITTLSIMTFSLMRNETRQSEWHWQALLCWVSFKLTLTFAECHFILNAIVLNFIMLSVVILSVVAHFVAQPNIVKKLSHWQQILKTIIWLNIISIANKIKKLQANVWETLETNQSTHHSSFDWATDIFRYV